MRNFLIVLLILVLGAVGLVYRRVQNEPADFKYTQTRMIEASCESVYNQLNDFKRWELWSPWVAKDPLIKFYYGGASAGVGATQSWHSSKSGSVEQSLTSLTPNSVVEYSFHMSELGSASAGRFTLTESPTKQCDVEWTIWGSRTTRERVLMVLLQMEAKMLEDLAVGLQRIEQLIKAPPTS